MQSYDNPFVVAEAPAETRATFYRKTYSLVAVAFVAWAAVLYGLLATGIGEPLTRLMLGNQFSWLIALGVFWLATTAAQSMAFSRASGGTQYAGLAIYIIAEAVIFVPLIYIVLNMNYAKGTAFTEIFLPAGTVTGLLIAGLTATVFMTRTDFSFLKTAVVLGSFAALGAIIVFSIFGINPGVWFAIAMVGLMCAAILWQTWQIKEKCNTDQHVGAAVLLFAGFVTLLWYVIQIFLSRRR